MQTSSCHRCGKVIPTDMPIGYQDQCEGCSADLHACHNCAQWDPKAENECLAGVAERMPDRAKANKCSLFELRVGPPPKAVKPSGRDAKQEMARKAIEGIFSKKKT